MKFGKHVERSSTPEWSSQYINYKQLKRTIKSIFQSNDLSPTNPKLQALKDDLLNELKKVNSFFLEREEEAIKRWEQLETQLNILSRRGYTPFAQKSGKAKASDLSELLQNDDVSLENMIGAEKDENNWEEIRLEVEELEKIENERNNPQNKDGTILKLSEGISALHPDIKTIVNKWASKLTHQLEAEKHINEVLHLITSGHLEKSIATVKQAFMDYYRGLILLKNFRILNYTGFQKILKKAKKELGITYQDEFMDIVSSQPFMTDRNVDTLLGECEEIFARWFVKGDLHQAKRKLRIPDSTNIKAWPPFNSGFLMGINLSLAFMIVGFLITYRNYTFPRTKDIYTMYTALGLPILMTWIFGMNKMIWTNTHVHYSFIFEFDPRNKLNYYQFFQIVNVLTFMWLLSVFIYLWTSTGRFIFPGSSQTPILQPLILACVFVALFFCPINIFFRSSRFWFLKVACRVISAPFIAVKFKDFFFGDQFSSLVVAIVQWQFLICFYSVDAWVPENQGVCWKINPIISPCLSFLPSWWRFLQCLRRYRDSNYTDKVHVANATKYGLSLVVVIFSGLDSNLSSTVDIKPSPYLVLWAIFATVSCLYSYWWDLFMDWSVFQKKANEGFWKYRLREKRMYKKTWVYYFAIGSNFVFRFGWAFTKSINQIGTILQHYQLATLFASVEIVRRGIWNLFRLENEHLNNVGKFRAVREIPLPFAEDEGMKKSV